MNGVMFRRRNCFQIARIISLHSGDEGHADLRGEEWIFAISFLAAAPTWIAENINVWRPESESVIARSIIVRQRVIIFGACLGGNYVGNRKSGVEGKSG